jgi:hypothetical protein
MLMLGIPFEATEWLAVERITHRGRSGEAHSPDESPHHSCAPFGARLFIYRGLITSQFT